MEVSGLSAALVGKKVEAVFSAVPGTQMFENIPGTVTFVDSGVVGLQMDKGTRTLVFSVDSPRYIIVP